MIENGDKWICNFRIAGSLKVTGSIPVSSTSLYFSSHLAEFVFSVTISINVHLVTSSYYLEINHGQETDRVRQLRWLSR